MKHSAIIIEDVEEHRNTLKNHLAHHCPEINVIGEAGEVNQAYNLISSLSPDLVFLDIQLEGGTAFNLLKKFGNDEIDFKIIFITGYGGVDNIARSLEFAGLDEFITKPPSPTDLKKAVELATKSFTEEEKLVREAYRGRLNSLLKNLVEPENENQEIAIPLFDRSFKYIPLKNISFFEADDPLVYVYLNDDSRLCSTKRIGKFWGLLKEQANFFKIHKSLVVNIDQVKGYYYSSREIVMKNGKKIIAAREPGKDFKAYLLSIKKYTHLVHGSGLLGDIKGLFGIDDN